MRRKANDTNLDSASRRPARRSPRVKKMLVLILCGVMLVSSVVLGSVLLSGQGTSQTGTTTASTVKPAAATHKPAAAASAPTAPVDTAAAASKKP